jgi:hypothetical protein
MREDETEELKCRFCGGPLRADEQKEPQRGTVLDFYRCEKCGMPNVRPVRKSETN